MRLFQIEYLKAVIGSGSISKAADELRISRPAVSKALSELESEYGVQLFVRASSGITLTEAGCVFYEKCTEIQKLIGSLENEMKIFREKDSKKNQRHLKIGLSPATGYAIFPDFCAKFLKEHPDITIEPIEIPYKQSCLMLEDGSIDASFNTVTASNEEMFSSIDIKEMELCFCCNLQHRLAGRKSVTVDDIRDEPLIQLDGNFKGREGIMDVAHERNDKFRTSQISMTRNMVSNGLCCCIQFREVMAGCPDVVTIPFEKPNIHPAQIRWNNAVKHNSAFADLIAFAKSYKKALPMGPSEKTTQ